MRSSWRSLTSSRAGSKVCLMVVDNQGYIFATNYRLYRASANLRVSAEALPSAWKHLGLTGDSGMMLRSATQGMVTNAVRVSEARGLVRVVSADDFWKKQAFSKASAVLTDHPEKVGSGKEAMKLKGVGKGCAAVVRCLHLHAPCGAVV